MGGHYGKGRRWRVEERYRFFTNQLYPHDVDSATGYKEQFKQVGVVQDAVLQAAPHCCRVKTCLVLAYDVNPAAGSKQQFRTGR